MERRGGMARIYVQEIKLYAEKNCKCSICGKRLKRRRKFYQTINPFNKRADGEVKTYSDIYPELREDAQKWERKPETCGKCKEAADDRK